jgi:hypothetical protein
MKKKDGFDILEKITKPLFAMLPDFFYILFNK